MMTNYKYEIEERVQMRPEGVELPGKQVGCITARGLNKNEQIVYAVQYYSPVMKRDRVAWLLETELTPAEVQA